MMITEADVTRWAQIGAAIAGGLGIVWNALKVHDLSVKWDGFKLEYDEAIKAQSRAEGHLDEQSDVRDRAEKKEKEDKP